MSDTMAADPIEARKAKGKAKAKASEESAHDETRDEPEVTGFQPCVGLPVQFHTNRGPVPGVLARKSLTTPGWDVKILPEGALSWVLRPSVQQCDEPMPGRWSLLPGFGG